MKSLFRCVLAVMLIIILPGNLREARAESAVEMATVEAGETELPLPEASPVPEAAPEPEATDAPAETIAPDAGIDPSDAESLMSLLAPGRSARISASWESEHLGVGDEITLRVVIDGYERVQYELIWQSSANGSDWVDQARGGSSFRYTLGRDSCRWMWRVVVVICAPAQQ